MEPILAAIAIGVVFVAAGVLVFVKSRSFPMRLAIWLAAGFFLSQCMHVLVFVLHDMAKSGETPNTVLNVLYFWHVPWQYVLVGSLLLAVILAVVVLALSRKENTIHIRWLLLSVSLAVFLSQFSGSSLPKLFGELSLGAFFILGILSYRYFLTYAPTSAPTVSQVQSDALTVFGMLVSLISIWAPFVLGFAEFLFNQYFHSDELMLQYQLTRYGAYVAWDLVAIGLIGWRALECLINARRGVAHA